MVLLDNYINDLIATSRERNAKKIFEEIVIQRAGKLKPYMIYIPLEFKYEELKDILFRQ